MKLKNSDVATIVKSIDVDDGNKVVLLDRLAKEKVYGNIECARNIFLTNQNGEVIWQVRTDFDSNSGAFTNIYVDEQGLKAYRWDGGVYQLNIENGIGIPILLAK